MEHLLSMKAPINRIKPESWRTLPSHISASIGSYSPITKVRATFVQVTFCSESQTEPLSFRVRDTFSDAEFETKQPFLGKSPRQVSTIGKSTNIVWHKCSVDRLDRQELLHQKGCVIWITGLSGSGKSTVACALGRALHSRGKLSYILDGDNVRHGLNQDLSFNAEDRAENIRRVGEVAKLFADSGIICIACLISPYRKDRDACRALLPDGDFIEVFMDVPIQVCEARDSKGLYKLARAGKIKGFTGIDDPYEQPLDCEIKIQQRGVCCASPCEMAETVLSYLEENYYLQA